ncbi:Bone morphogenetic protein 1-like [Holothuria leucospilota]|uniref:Bone morphogenetic protein 1-like n=1 Tax=Holothuria leucospilota TaxID=206669 RepID=A0A9Q1BCK3_HOLLE|nr:Bone morphogenetic protein 1-like [Holothuria leucospilota]
MSMEMTSTVPISSPFLTDISSMSLFWILNWKLQRLVAMINYRIFDGIDNTTNEIAELCGEILPDPVFTSGSDSFIEFTSDASVTRTGFKAVITSALNVPQTDCDNIYTDESETVTSPNYPDDYGINEDCGNTIQAPAGRVIRLTFQTFHLESTSATCTYDSVNIYEGDSTSSPLLAGPFCGSTIPPPVTSTGNVMYVYFESDGSVQESGFLATFEFL